MNTFLKYLLFPVLLLVAIRMQAQQPDSTSKAYFEYIKGQKCINLNGATYHPISPSIFVAKGDTLEKLQHPLGGKPAIQRPDYVLIAVIWEPLAFRNSECTSKQIVDIYRKKRFVKKEAPQMKPEIRYIRKDTTIYCDDVVYVDTGRVVYKMPIDTGGLWITLGLLGDATKYVSSNHKASGGIKIVTEAVLWNGDKPQTPPTDTSKADSTKAKVPIDTKPLLRNLRAVVSNEIGFERARTAYAVSDDTCFVCAEEAKLWQMTGEAAAGVQWAPRRPLNDEQLQFSTTFEVRYKYLGRPNNLPDYKGISRISLNLVTRADYGPFTFKVAPRWTPGLGFGWNAGLSYNFVKWAPKKSSNLKLRLPRWQV